MSFMMDEISRITKLPSKIIQTPSFWFGYLFSPSQRKDSYMNFTSDDSNNLLEAITNVVQLLTSSMISNA
jgi:hypothetical protein